MRRGSVFSPGRNPVVVSKTLMRYSNVLQVVPRTLERPAFHQTYSDGPEEHFWGSLDAHIEPYTNTPPSLVTANCLTSISRCYTPIEI